MAPRPGDGQTRETRAGVGWCRTARGTRAERGSPLDAGRHPGAPSTPGFNGHRRARPPPGRDPRPDHAYDSRAPGLPACRARRDGPMDGRDPPEAAALLRDEDVPVPSATPPAPTWDRADAAAPPPPRARKTRPPASPPTTRPHPSTPRGRAGRPRRALFGDQAPGGSRACLTLVPPWLAPRRTPPPALLSPFSKGPCALNHNIPRR